MMNTGISLIVVRLVVAREIFRQEKSLAGVHLLKEESRKFTVAGIQNS